ncbi:MAG: Glycosyl transferase family 2 [Candidatus Gottesmanbacteria bacterium GW2011_GWA1_34_13]|uniref:Glycosyl transferase family 2 n=1 Tax=Candidatus Gottesmanbacteria bacterium GW2011_GWA1_34_13 TaxID=1618434 RepID=A0A0G0B603_9BACT|nr:MAG: Glycosyl transferase family 2 [Candidatus Gottesmanbacteria bacterium GW2011_GWA1_34_13]
MHLSVVIVTYNNQKTITSCLKSVIAENPQQVIVVDNASSDKTLNLVSEKFPSVDLIKNTSNLGYAKGNNIGISAALIHNPDYVLVLNPDTTLKPSVISKLVNCATSLNNEGVFGPKILNSQDKIWSIGGDLDKKRYSAKLIGLNTQDTNTKQTNECDFISGTCMLLPKKMLDTSIRFFEPYFLYYEDVEFCQRLKKLGYPSICTTSAQIVHYESSSTSLASIKNYYLARNHLLFVVRNAPFRVKLREGLRLPKTIWEHYRNKDFYGLKGIKDYLFAKFGKYAK